jgi:hypothetical protein
MEHDFPVEGTIRNESFVVPSTGKSCSVFRVRVVRVCVRACEAVCRKISAEPGPCAGNVSCCCCCFFVALGVPGGVPIIGVPIGVPSGVPIGVPVGVPTSVPIGVPVGVPAGAPTGVRDSSTGVTLRLALVQVQVTARIEFRILDGLQERGLVP